jgi:hypothetical protein
MTWISTKRPLSLAILWMLGSTTARAESGLPQYRVGADRPPLQCSVDDYPVQIGPATCQSRVLAVALASADPKLFPIGRYEELAGLERLLRAEIESQAGLAKRYCSPESTKLCPLHEDWRTAIRVATSAQFEFVSRSARNEDELVDLLGEIAGWSFLAGAGSTGDLGTKGVAGISVKEIDGQVYPQGHVLLVLGVDVPSRRLLIANSWAKDASGRALLTGYVAFASQIKFNGLSVYQVRRAQAAPRKKKAETRRRQDSPVANPPAALGQLQSNAEVPHILGKVSDYRSAAAYALTLAAAARDEKVYWPVEEEFALQRKALDNASVSEIARILEGTLALARTRLETSTRPELAALANSPLLSSASLVRLSDLDTGGAVVEGVDVRAVLQDNAPLLALLSAQAPEAVRTLASVKDVRVSLQDRVPSIPLKSHLGGRLMEEATRTPFGQAVSIASRLASLPKNDPTFKELGTAVEGVDTALAAYQAIGAAVSADDKTLPAKGRAAVAALRALGPLIPLEQQGDFNRALAIADVAIAVASASSGAGYASAALSLSTSLFGGGGGALGNTDSLAGVHAELKAIQQQLASISQQLGQIRERLDRIDARLYSIEQGLSETQRLIREESRSVIAEVRGGYVNKKNDDWSTFEEAVAAGASVSSTPSSSVVRELRHDRINSAFSILLNYLEPDIGGLGHPSIAGPEGCASDQLEKIRSGGATALEEEAQSIARTLKEPNFGGRAYCVAEFLGGVVESLSRQPTTEWLPEASASSSLLVPTAPAGNIPLNRTAYPVAPPMSLGYFLAKADASLVGVEDVGLRARLTEKLLVRSTSALRGYGTVSGPYAPAMWAAAYRQLHLDVKSDMAHLTVQPLIDGLKPLSNWFEQDLKPTIATKKAVFDTFGAIPNQGLEIPWDAPTFTPLAADATDDAKAKKDAAYAQARKWYDAAVKKSSDGFTAAEESNVQRRLLLLNKLLEARDKTLEILTKTATKGSAKLTATNFEAEELERVAFSADPQGPLLARRYLLKTAFPRWQGSPQSESRELALRLDRSVGRLFGRLIQIGNCLQYAQPVGSDFSGGDKERPSSVEQIPVECQADPRTRSEALLESPKWDKLNENVARAQRAVAEAQVHFLSDLDEIVDLYLGAGSAGLSLRQREDRLLREWLALRVIERLLEDDLNVGSPKTFKGSDRLAQLLAPHLERFRRAHDPGDLGTAYSLEVPLGRWSVVAGGEPPIVAVSKRWQCGAEAYRECGLHGIVNDLTEWNWYRPRASYRVEARDIGPSTILDTKSAIADIALDLASLDMPATENEALSKALSGGLVKGLDNSGIIYATEVFERLRKNATSMGRRVGSKDAEPSRIRPTVGLWSGLALASDHPTRYAGAPLNPYFALGFGRWSAGIALSAGPKLHGPGPALVLGYRIAKGLRATTGWRPERGLSPHRLIIGLAFDVWQG